MAIKSEIGERVYKLVGELNDLALKYHPDRFAFEYSTREHRDGPDLPRTQLLNCKVYRHLSDPELLAADPVYRARKAAKAAEAAQEP